MNPGSPATASITAERRRAGSGWGELRSDRPEVQEERRGEGWLERRCRVPDDLSCFDGHFPDGAIVPGVLQLAWAFGLAAELLGEEPRIAELETVRFRTPLLPGDAFDVGVRTRAGGRIEFRVRGERGEHAVGRARLGAAGATA